MGVTVTVAVRDGVRVGGTGVRVGVSVDGSLPFLFTPAEARLVETLPGARRVFERILAIGHGGAHDAGAGGAAGDDTVSRFRALNLAHAEVLGDILGVEPLTVARVETILGKMDKIVAEFTERHVGAADEPLPDAWRFHPAVR